MTLEQQKQAQLVEDTFTETFMTVTWMSVPLQLLTAVILKKVWTLVNILQFAVFLPLWSLNYPQIVKSFLQAVKIIAFFEFLPTGWFSDALSDLFGLSDCSDDDE